MKYCPTCEKRYDEEILRFCMKDGTPLIDEDEPKFIEMPSESLAAEEEDDLGEVTIIRKNKPVPPAQVPSPPPNVDEDFSFAPKEEPPARFVIPTSPEPQRQARVIPPYQPPPKSNSLKVAVLTMFGTIVLLALGGGVVWLAMRGSNSNTNTNANVNLNANLNTNLNTNLGLDTNFNFNVSGNFNSNSNANANANKSPSPTPKPSPSVTPSPSPTPDDDATPTPRPPINVNRPSPTPPRMLPANRPSNRPSNN